MGLTIWSFLMATAHGAGLMVLPLLLDPGSAIHAADHHASSAAGATLLGALVATAVHGAGYLAVTAIVAVVVFEKVGVGILRRAWINLDRIWAIALLVTGLLTLIR